MGTITNLIGGAVGTLENSLIKQKGTHLEDFLAKFSSSEGRWIDQLDPLNTFDVMFTFSPSSTDIKKEDTGLLKKLTNAAISAAKTATRKAANNITGGLLGAYMNSKSDVLNQRDNFKNGTSQGTFLEYLASANLLVNKESWFGENAGQKSDSPLILQLGLYISYITLPQLEMHDISDITTTFGPVPVNSPYLSPTQHYLRIYFLNTKLPLVERLFYPWLRECTLPYWSYDIQPYTTAKITIDFSKHCDVRYIFYGCRPQLINPISPKQSVDGDINREVAFIFDYFGIESDLKVSESVSEKLITSSNSLARGAGILMNM